MKKCIAIVLLFLFTVNLCACGKKTKQKVQKWDYFISVADESQEDQYVITWDTTKHILSKTGSFSIHNRNDFNIVVHLITTGEEELSLEIRAGEVGTIHQVTKNAAYQVGIHADADADTPLEITVYDGDSTYPD